jgi:hypothetical protein
MRWDDEEAAAVEEEEEGGHDEEPLAPMSPEQYSIHVASNTRPIKAFDNLDAAFVLLVSVLLLFTALILRPIKRPVAEDNASGERSKPSVSIGVPLKDDEVVGAGSFFLLLLLFPPVMLDVASDGASRYTAGMAFTDALEGTTAAPVPVPPQTTRFFTTFCARGTAPSAEASADES